MDDSTVQCHTTAIREDGRGSDRSMTIRYGNVRVPPLRSSLRPSRNKNQKNNTGSPSCSLSVSLSSHSLSFLLPRLRLFLFSSLHITHTHTTLVFQPSLFISFCSSSTFFSSADIISYIILTLLVTFDALDYCTLGYILVYL